MSKEENREMPSGKSSSLREKAGRGRQDQCSGESEKSKHLIEVQRVGALAVAK
jgi:hypothetical protein